MRSERADLIAVIQDLTEELHKYVFGRPEQGPALVALARARKVLADYYDVSVLYMDPSCSACSICPQCHGHRICPKHVKPADGVGPCGCDENPESLTGS